MIILTFEPAKVRRISEIRASFCKKSLSHSRNSVKARPQFRPDGRQEGPPVGRGTDCTRKKTNRIKKKKHTEKMVRIIFQF